MPFVIFRRVHPPVAADRHEDRPVERRGGRLQPADDPIAEAIVPVLVTGLAVLRDELGAERQSVHRRPEHRFEVAGEQPTAAQVKEGLSARSRAELEQPGLAADQRLAGDQVAEGQRQRAADPRSARSTSCTL
jgi:hypothetical protein